MTQTQKNKGFFVTLEGIDGTGKTTLCNNLFNEWTENTYDLDHPLVCLLPENVQMFTYPHKSKENICNKLSINKEDHTAMALSHFLDFRLLMNEIKNHIDQGDIVIKDRWTTSCFVYQSRIQEENAANPFLLHQLERFVTDIEPDLQVFLFFKSLYEGDESILKERMENKKEEFDLEFLKKAQHSYLNCAYHVPKNTLYVDADLPMAEIVKKVWNEIMRLWMKDLT